MINDKTLCLYSTKQRVNARQDQGTCSKTETRPRQLVQDQDEAKTFGPRPRQDQGSWLKTKTRRGLLKKASRQGKTFKKCLEAVSRPRHQDQDYISGTQWFGAKLSKITICLLVLVANAKHQQLFQFLWTKVRGHCGTSRYFSLMSKLFRDVNEVVEQLLPPLPIHKYYFYFSLHPNVYCYVLLMVSDADIHYFIAIVM